MFKDYLRRQLSNRGKVYDKLAISKSTYYRHLNDPTLITLGELRQMVLIGELDEEEVLSWIYGRKKK